MTLIRKNRIFTDNDESGGGGGTVNSVTGDSVDNTDPNNPVINAVPLSGTTPGNEITGNLDFSGALLGLYSDNAFEIQSNGVTDYSKAWTYLSDTSLELGFTLLNGIKITDQTVEIKWNNFNIIEVGGTGNLFITDNLGNPKIEINPAGQLILIIPTSPVGLLAGAIWNDGGTVKIV